MNFSILFLFASAVTAKTFSGLNYNPKRPDGSCPTVDDVKKDLSVLSKYTDTLRIYSAKDCDQGEPVLRAIEGTSWKIYLGMWVGSDDASYLADKKEIIRLSQNFDLKKYVKAIIVGSEAVYRKEQTSAQMAEKVNDMRSALAGIELSSIPLTVSETWPFYDSNIINSVDFIDVNIFPFWEGKTIEESNSVIFKHIYDLQAISTGKKVIVGETGWPSGGDNYEAAVPSVKNSQRYMGEFICRAQKENIDYVWFSAFDAPWASSNNASNVEKHWGIIESDNKTPKYSGNSWFDCDEILESLEDSTSSSNPSSTSSSNSPSNSPSTSPSTSPSETSLQQSETNSPKTRANSTDIAALNSSSATSTSFTHQNLSAFTSALSLLLLLSVFML
ncbi:hypothetical protein BB561_002927 [Smittium simulii]|uniref:glucan endo-1,3-beta-D-glucosidase n=1 Tax=Smittium simulii TaxID=133385 RepID=A0A2T9YNN9_9FUNG|nr:hypothetical protein BB561_002927 [Smittium simulii]